MILLRAFLVGLIFLAVYSIKNPEKTFMFGRKWMYNNDPEPSEMSLDFTRIQGIVFAIFFTIIFLLTFIMQF